MWYGVFMDDTSPEAFGRFLRTHATYAKNTCPKKGQVSRIDATCWYLSKVSHATSRDVKRFITAFKGRTHTYSGRRRLNGAWVHRTWQGLEPAYAMLNTAYGGVGMDFNGTLRTCITGSHYGPVAPLYRPLPKHYANTVAGLVRAAKIQTYIDSQ